jgi:hypothetical protein
VRDLEPPRRWVLVQHLDPFETGLAEQLLGDRDGEAEGPEPFPVPLAVANVLAGEGARHAEAGGEGKHCRRGLVLGHVIPERLLPEDVCEEPGPSRGKRLSHLSDGRLDMRRAG